jgi:hypothetical protein
MSAKRISLNFDSRRTCRKRMCDMTRLSATEMVGERRLMIDDAVGVCE